MSSAPRPEWTRTPPGIPYDCVARVCGSTAGSGAQQDLVLSRTGVSVLRPGSLQPQPGDQYELGYVYGPESSNADLLSRSLMPLLRKWTDGYNVTLMALGATGSGKTFSLEGGRAQDAGRGSSQGDGLVHLTADACFRLLQHKAAAVGEAAAAKRRGPVNRAFDFFLESSFVELYSETCHDLYAQGAARQSSLAVYEDEMEGFTVSGLTYRPARSEVELRAAFNAGRAARDVRRDDLGDVSDRCAALFTLHLAQSTPAATAGEEDRVLVSRLQFVELPGAERLAVEPEVLRLREGPGLNKGLTAWAHCIRSAAESRSAAELSPVEGSLLTRLLADALGGNALVLLLGCLRPGDWAVSRLTCELLATAQRVRTCPIINHGRARACLLKLRCRLLAVADERQALREQLAELPAEGDPNAVALSLARVRDVEARVLAEREEKARLVEEVAALQARLARLHEAGQAEEGSQAELQEALIKSEELRLGLAQTLIDTQLEMTAAEEGWSAERLELMQRLTEAEAGQLEGYVRQEEFTALQQQADLTRTQLQELQERLQQRESTLTAAEGDAARLKSRLQAAEAELGAVAGDAGPLEGGAAGEGVDPNSLAGRRRALLTRLKAKERRCEELDGEVKEARREADRLRNCRTLTQSGLDEMREAYRRRLEVSMREVADLSRAVAVLQTDPGSGLAAGPEDLFSLFQRLTDENLKVTEARERELRGDLDSLQGRHTQLKRKFRALYLAYRQARYLVEDQWPGDSAAPPLQLPSEEEVLGAALDTLLRSDEEAERRMMARLREQASQQASQLGALNLAEAAAAKGVGMKAGSLAAGVRHYGAAAGDKLAAEVPGMWQLESEALRREVEALRSGEALGSPELQVLRRDKAVLEQQVALLSSDATRSQLAQQLAEAQQDVVRLQREVQEAGGGPQGSVARLVQEFSSKTQADLERRLLAAESGRVMAEEQLSSMQAYLTKATLGYQREIVRLRAVLGQADPSGVLLRSDPMRGR